MGAGVADRRQPDVGAMSAFIRRWAYPGPKREKPRFPAAFFGPTGAGEGIRTLDPNLGNGQRK